MIDLLHNPIADLPSRQFLALYAIWCLIVLFVANRMVRSGDSSASSGWEPLPRDLDPNEIAYLRGDVNELVRFLIFDLVRSGALEFVPKEKKQPAQFRRTAAPPASLSPASQVIYDYFVEPHSVEDLFKSEVPAGVAAAYAEQRKSLDGRQLFNTLAMRVRANRIRVVALLAILSLGAYRLWYAATMHHRNVIFLIIMGVVAAILLLPATAVPRLSRRGLQYLRTLRAGLAPSGTAVADSPAFPLIVAAGGLAVLAGTPLAAMGATFRQQAAANSTAASSGCGFTGSSGCGSGGSSGGGCGSGCGGGCGG